MNLHIDWRTTCAVATICIVHSVKLSISDQRHFIGYHVAYKNRSVATETHKFWPAPFLVLHMVRSWQSRPRGFTMMDAAAQLLWLCLCLFSYSVFATSPPSDSSSQSVPELPSTLYQNLASELSVSSSLDILCSGKHFGFHPSFLDCQAAQQTIIPDMTQHIFGERHTGLGDDVFPLPFRVMGGMLP